MLHQILPVLFLPLGFCLLFILAGLILKKWWLSLFGVALLWVFSMPIVGNGLTVAVSRGYARIPATAVPDAHAIVVLSGMINTIKGAPDGEWNDAVDRFEGGIRLYKAGKAPVLVFTGSWIFGNDHIYSEGMMLANRAKQLGVPELAIRITDKVGSTAEEAVAICRFMKAEPGKDKTILLVTSAYHMHRAVLLFRKAGVNVIPYPVDFAVEQDAPLTIMSFLPNADSLLQSERALHELLGIAYSMVKKG
jgi:uncharacterized SAM-binding protein YcdF (DUF218 family)